MTEGLQIHQINFMWKNEVKMFRVVIGVVQNGFHE